MCSSDDARRSFKAKSPVFGKPRVRSGAGPAFADKTVSAQKPEQNRQRHPHHEGCQKSECAVPKRRQPPCYNCKTDKSDASDRRAARVERSSLAPATRLCDPRSSFLFSLVLFYQRRAGGEDCWESEEQTSEYGSVMACQHSCNNCNCASEEESERILIPLCSS